jgi:small subunit ribosomal protein S14
MSKKSVIEREKKRAILVKKYSNLRQELKTNIKNATTIEEKLFIYGKLQNLPRNSSIVRSL